MPAAGLKAPPLESKSPGDPAVLQPGTRTFDVVEKEAVLLMSAAKARFVFSLMTEKLDSVCD